MKKIIAFYVLGLCLLILPFVLIPKPKCGMRDMLLSIEDYPAGTQLGEIIAPTSETFLSASVGGSLNGSLIHQNVAHYPWISVTNKEYERIKHDSSGKARDGGFWETPPELNRTSSFFQNYYVACGNALLDYQCRMVGQYDHYLVFYFAYIEDEGITLDMLADILPKIDARMAYCLAEK